MIDKDSERCSNCGRYPFCNKCSGPLGHCDDWKKRPIGAKNE